MDLIYQAEIPWIQSFQEAWSGPDHAWEDLWVRATKLGDPAWAFYVFFPLLYPWMRVTSTKFLVAAVVSEFSNGVFKWFLHGQRPYWYAKEYGLGSVHQFRYSCETGPGSPSGHVMVTSAVLSTILLQMTPGVKRIVSLGLGVCVVLLVGLSRVFISAHFFHQIVLGAVVGGAFGFRISHWHPQLWRRLDYFHLASLLFLAGVGMYQLLLFQGVDPMWSVLKARDACHRSDWIHVSTTPMSALVRDIATIAALAFIAPTATAPPHHGHHTTITNTAIGVLNLVVIQAASHLAPFPSNLLAYYASYFLFNVAAILFCFWSLLLVSTKSL